MIDRQWIGRALGTSVLPIERTRLHKAGESTARIGGREIKRGVDRDLLDLMERSIPLGRGGTPDEAADAVYLLTIPESDYVSGQTLLCSGGLTAI